ncbi:MAG: TrbI/VirB10 family protein [Nostoc sp. DedSLP03]|uniref:TrbI/VirB10 family protein n=1 Tax=Nostoc sp. DedSLP03 TaxID=3075400 RepID=UPI002AD2F0AD|nr:TrbI/VirB10 family protein [Nostoc sp. DedSLP03]MDZ7966440.1 TrbI/VirB10 family protein [Nostoc sp. DedSLP03]
MTRYSIPAETPPQNGFTLTTDDRQPEVESVDWESRMSRLVGFEEESSSSDIQGSEDSATPPEPLSLPQEVQTKQALSSNPFAKLGLVGAATLAIVLVGGVFLSQLMSGNNQKPKTIVSPPVQEQPTDESISQQMAAQVDTLKTKLALTEQAQMVKDAQQQLRIAKSTPTVALRQPSVSQKAIPTPPPTAYVPRTVTVERIIRVPASQPSRSPQLPVVTPNTQPPNTQTVVNITPPSPPSPFAEWARLAKLGSYGQVNPSNQPTSNIATLEPATNAQPQQEATNPNPEQNTPQPAENSAVSQAQPQGEKSVAVGSSAKAVLATAIFGETTNKSGGGGDADEAKNVFVIRLKEPLKSTDGTVALPANTEFLAEIGSLSEQGLLQMNVVKVISQNNGNRTEQSLPNNAIILRGTQGKPLIANKYPGQSSSIASMDAGLFVLGGIGKAAELVNRSDSEYQYPTINPTTNPDGSSNGNVTSAYPILVTKNRRNLGAAVLEGGMNSVVPQIAQRNQQAIAQMSQQGGVWFLPAGTNIEIYVNQATQF